MTKYNAYCLIRKTGISNIELEEIISKHGFYSYDYAISVLKCRFRLGEEIIIKYTNSNYYCDYFIKVMGYNHE